MLAINTNSNYFIENQPSVAKELLESLKKLFNDFIGEKIANQRFENLKKDFMFLTNEAHRLNAEIEIIRDFIDNYYINDASSDEKILNASSNLFSLSKLTPNLKMSERKSFDESSSIIFSFSFISPTRELNESANSLMSLSAEGFITSSEPCAALWATPDMRL